jgi:hypothetical protein
MAPLETVIHECLHRGYVYKTDGYTEAPFGEPMSRNALYTELVREFGTRIRNFPQSPQLFWAELKACVTAKNGRCLLTDAFEGKRKQHNNVRDRWVELPSLEKARAWWCTHKFVDGWGQDPGRERKESVEESLSFTRFCSEVARVADVAPLSKVS